MNGTNHSGYPIHNDSGRVRTVGFEIEFSGAEISDVANMLRKNFSGKVVEKNLNEFYIDESDLGKFKIEVDAELLKRLAEISQDNREEDKLDVHGTIEKSISHIAGDLIPIEIVCPPVNINCLDKLDVIISGLRERGAKGTKHSFLSAFGVHINPELPENDVETIVAYLQAFMLSRDWLVKEIDVDLTRAISQYIQAYSQEYVGKVLSPDYHPTPRSLIDDYLSYHPTRNMELDLLPLFSYLHEDLVKNVVTSTLIKPRPTLHYRLPNTRLDIEDWSFSTEWQRWQVVEKIANDQALRNQLIEKYIENKYSTSVIERKSKWCAVFEEYTLI